MSDQLNEVISKWIKRMTILAFMSGVAVGIFIKMLFEELVA